MKMMTQNQKEYIIDLATQAGKDDPEFYIHEVLGHSRTESVTQKVTHQQAMEIIAALCEELE
jgi:hypothetical protein